VTTISRKKAAAAARAVEQRRARRLRIALWSSAIGVVAIVVAARDGSKPVRHVGGDRIEGVLGLAGSHDDGDAGAVGVGADPPVDDGDAGAVRVVGFACRPEEATKVGCYVMGLGRARRAGNRRRTAASLRAAECAP